jgi:DNA-binding transcriptional ArsR family regulator
MDTTAADSPRHPAELDRSNRSARAARPVPFEPLDRLEHQIQVLKAVAHPVRLRIIAVLCRAEASVTELSRELEVPQPLISQQLRLLRMLKLVDTKRHNGFAIYRLKEPLLRRLLRCIEACGGESGEGHRKGANRT